MSKHIAILILIGIILFTGITGFLSSKLEFDYDFEHFFPQDDPDLDYFLKYRSTYENDNDYILISIGEGKSIFSGNFLEKADQFSDELKELNYVENIISPTKVKQPILSTFGSIEIPLIHINNPEKFKPDSIRITKSKEFVRTLFSKDFTSICIVVNNTQIISKKASDELLTNIEALLEKYQFKRVHYAGKIRGQKAYLTKMKTELIIFLSISVFLITIFLLLSFRSIFGIVIPVLTVLIAIIGVLGIIQFTGKSLNVMTTLLPTILFVVGMSDAVHILNKYIEELRNKSSKINAIKTTFKEIGTATLLTSITTSVGFITLMTVKIKPIQEFGLYTAIGVILAFVIAILFLPAILSIVKTPRIVLTNVKTTFWDKTLSKSFLFTIKNQRKIIVAYIFITIVSIIGILQLKIDYHILEDLSEKDPLQQDFRFFENNYSGIRPFEMAISVKNSTNKIFDFNVMQEMDKIETYLYNEYGVGFIFSPVAFIKSVNKSMHNGNSSYYKVPNDQSEYEKLIKKLNRLNFEDKLRKIVKDDHKEARFTGKLNDIGSAKMKKLNIRFHDFFQSSVNTDIIDYKITGTALLLDKNNEFLAKNMLTGLGIAFLLIALIIGGIFKSVKMALISLVPNVVPLTIIGGLMGYFGTNINISTSIIFTIAFGIAVDDTIHFLSKFKIESNKKNTFLLALKRTYLSTGKAIVLTTIILCGGFISLIFSDFKSTFLIGLYVSLILFIAVITDLFLLPVLLIMINKKKT